MRKALKSILAVLLVVSMLLCTTLSAFAVDGEEYICELRLIYAENYEEAQDILADSEFSDYKLLNENLNKNTDEIGVWLAYKTTTDIDDAITDIAVMQMNGGYTLGNYQEMLKESYDEYVVFGETYLQAIEYFIEAYEAGDFLAESAYRQLNFYNGLDDREGERLGDVFYEGVDEFELATMFLEGNSYALKNIRSLIAMGVSYNEDGKTYLQKVGDEAAALTEDPDLYADEDYEELAAMLAPTVTVFREMFKELATYESEFNYADDELTTLELKYMEYMAIAQMMRRVNYLDGKTLYQFCLDYEVNEEDYSALYPLVAALNEGQLAMSHVAHYYDVVRYSMEIYPREDIEEQLATYEEKYGDCPFNVYTGVDRSIFEGSLALTTEAARADAYNEVGVAETFFSSEYATPFLTHAGGFALGTTLLIAAIMNTDVTTTTTTITVQQQITNAQNAWATKSIVATKQFPGSVSVTDAVTSEVKTTVISDNAANTLLQKYSVLSPEQLENLSSMSYAQKIDALDEFMMSGTSVNKMDWYDSTVYHELSHNHSMAEETLIDSGAKDITTTSTSLSVSPMVAMIYVIGGAVMLYSAFQLGKTIYDYYHPDYEDVPIAMVDLVETVDGDRYIKYDVVYNAETNKDGVYEAADLNAFEAKRWNALYYTKSYEAGKPLLADAFSVSNSSNQPKSGYAPVHRFGEEVCYDLNKYNYDGDTSIYLSVKQSKNDKSAVTDVPEVVGSMFGAGFLFLAGGIGVIAGVGGLLATRGIIKNKRSKADGSDAVAEETADT